MPIRSSTLPCQVNGLKAIYVCNNSVCFEFENAEQLKKAKKKAALVYKTKPAFNLLSRSKNPVFAFSVSKKPRVVTNNLVNPFIVKVVNTMTTQTSKKIIPVVNYLKLIF